MRNVARLMLVLLLAVAVQGCASIERKWRQATELDTEESYATFLAESPEDAPYRRQAKERLDTIRMEETLEDASLPAALDFLRTDSDSQMKVSVFEQMWARLWGESTIQACEALAEFCRSAREAFPEAGDAFFSRHEALIDAEMAWYRAVDSPSINGLRQFLVSFPSSAHAEEAEEKLEALEWETADRDGSIESYLEFWFNHRSDAFGDRIRDGIYEVLKRRAESQDTPQAWFNLYLFACGRMRLWTDEFGFGTDTYGPPRDYQPNDRMLAEAASAWENFVRMFSIEGVVVDVEVSKTFRTSASRVEAHCRDRLVSALQSVGLYRQAETAYSLYVKLDVGRANWWIENLYSGNEVTRGPWIDSEFYICPRVGISIVHSSYSDGIDAAVRSEWTLIRDTVDRHVGVILAELAHAGVLREEIIEHIRIGVYVPKELREKLNGHIRSDLPVRRLKEEAAVQAHDSSMTPDGPPVRMF